MKGTGKAGCFLLEGINAFASSFYFYYLFFFMAREFGFGDRENLFLAALNGFVYTFAARYGGRFAQRRGYFPALRLGFSILSGVLFVECFARSAWQHVALLPVWTFGLCFTWPTLEALVSEHENPARLPRMIGIYNVVWSGAGAISYFIGGAVLEHFGMKSLFVVPLVLHLFQLWLVRQLDRANLAKSDRAVLAGEETPSVLPLNPRPIAKAKSFLRLAWFANPFAYVAINTVAAVIPRLAREMQLSPMWAGFVASVWFFTRWMTFCVLWRWEGWHYKFRWFLGAYVLLMATFLSILLAPFLWVLLLAELGFGIASGLLYYSSLFYSMDVGETKGEHGGIHEAVIGLGIFAGPAIGAGALTIFPASPQAGVWAVSGLLCGGLLGVLLIRQRRAKG